MSTIPILDKMFKAEEIKVRQKIELETLRSLMAEKITRNDIPALVKIETLVTEEGFLGKVKATKPCITIVHKTKSTSWYSYCITVEYEYGISYVKLFLYGNSPLSNLRLSNDGNNQYTRRTEYIQQWEAETRYYTAVALVFHEMFE